MDPYTEELLRAAADGDVHFFASHGKVIGIDSCRDESGNSALLLATRHGHKGLVELFIHQYDANINAKNGDNETPLSYAAENGHRDLVNVLLQFTNKISTKSYEQAVAKAAENGRMDIVELLLDNGNIDSAAKDHYASEAIASAARGGHISLLQRLFSTYEIDLSSKKTGGYLALLSAAQAGHKDVVELLLGRQDVDKKAQSANGRTALHLSVQAGHIGVVKLLTGRNDIEMSASDANGDTALHLAAWDGQTDAVKLLLEKDETKVNARNASGRTALSVALGQGHADVVELLLERDDVELGGNTFSIDDSIRKATTNEYIGLTDFQVANKCPGRSLLSWTAENGQIEALSILLARDHTGVNSTDGDGRTPLSRAAEKGHKLAAKMLLKYNADANAKDGDSQTPLSRVAAHGHEKVVEMLLQHNADPNSTDRDGRAPLWWAVKNGHAACAEHLIPVDTSTLLLLMHENTQTALEFLLRFKPRLDQRDHQGRTALHLAAEWGDLDIARAVILQGGKLDSKDNRNITPLQIAMREGHIKIIQELLKQKVCTKGIMTKEWRDAYGKQKQDIFLLSETPGGQQYPDFPQKFPTWQELSQTSTKCKSRLYVANSSMWPKMFIGTLPGVWLADNCFEISNLTGVNILHTSVAFRLPLNQYVHNQPSNVDDDNVMRIMWISVPPISPGGPWTPMVYCSTLPYGWIPDNGMDFFHQFLTHIKAQWLELCIMFGEHLSAKRLEQFESKGKNSEITDCLAKDAQAVARLRTVLAGLTSDAERFMNNYCARFNADNIPKDLQKLIKDDMEVGINKRLEDLDQTVRDLLQIEFAWITIHETRVSTKLGQNVMLLTYVSIFYLPLGFCAALWAIPNIADDNTRTPFIVTATMVSLFTLLVTFNMEKIATTIEQGYQYCTKFIPAEWKRDKR